MIRRIQNIIRHPAMIRLITLGDQCMFALGNFLLTVSLTRYYRDEELAAFGLAVSIALLLQGVQRNSYIIQNSVLQNNIFRGRGRKILGEHMIAVQPLLAVLAVLSLGVIILGGAHLFWLTLVATAACFAIYSNLEIERIIFIKYERYIMPLITSFVFLAMAAALLFLHEHLSFFAVMVMLWVYACLKTAFLIYVVGMPDMRGGLVLLRSDFRRNSVSSLLGVIGSSGYTHMPILVLGMVAAPVQTAALVAMRGLMQPTQIVMRSLDIIDKNFFRASAAKNGRGVSGALRRQLLLYIAVSSAMSLVICFFGQELIGVLYKGKHMEFLPLLYGFGLISVFYAVIFPLESAIIVLKRLNIYNVQRFWLGIGVSILSVALCILYGAVGAIMTYIVAWIVLIGLSLFLAFDKPKGDA